MPTDTGMPLVRSRRRRRHRPLLTPAHPTSPWPLRRPVRRSGRSTTLPRSSSLRPPPSNVFDRDHPEPGALVRFPSLVAHQAVFLSRRALPRRACRHSLKAGRRGAAADGVLLRRAAGGPSPRGARGRGRRRGADAPHSGLGVLPGPIGVREPLRKPAREADGHREATPGDDQDSTDHGPPEHRLRAESPRVGVPVPVMFCGRSPPDAERQYTFPVYPI